MNAPVGQGGLWDDLAEPPCSGLVRLWSVCFCDCLLVKLGRFWKIRRPQRLEMFQPYPNFSRWGLPSLPMLIQHFKRPRRGLRLWQGKLLSPEEVVGITHELGHASGAMWSRTCCWITSGWWFIISPPIGGFLSGVPPNHPKLDNFSIF